MKKKPLVRKTKSPEPPRSLLDEKAAPKPLNLAVVLQHKGLASFYNGNLDTIAPERSPIKKPKPKPILESEDASEGISRIEFSSLDPPDELSSKSSSQKAEPVKNIPKITTRTLRDSKFSLNLGFPSKSTIGGGGWGGGGEGGRGGGWGGGGPIAKPKNIILPRNSIMPQSSGIGGWGGGGGEGGRGGPIPKPKNIILPRNSIMPQSSRRPSASPQQILQNLAKNARNLAQKSPKPRASIFHPKKSQKKSPKKSILNPKGWQPITHEQIFAAMAQKSSRAVELVTELESDITHTKNVGTHFERKRKSFRYRWAEFNFDFEALRRDSYKAWKFSHLGVSRLVTNIFSWGGLLAVFGDCALSSFEISQRGF